MKFIPHDYQKYAIEYIESHPISAVFLDMGLGKTVFTLTAIAYLLFDSFEILRILIIGPLRVARDTWTTEADKWDHLQNLICSLIFYDYGLGLARRFPDVDNTVLTMVVYAVVCAMLITLSWAWLRRFPRGPVEWVWHLSYEAICRVLARRAQKRALRRAGSDTPAPVS